MNTELIQFMSLREQRLQKNRGSATLSIPVSSLLKRLGNFAPLRSLDFYDKRRATMSLSFGCQGLDKFNHCL